MYTIYLTTKCNFSCSYCYENFNDFIELNEDKLIDILQFIFKYDKSPKILIDFMGGEPLLKKELIYKAIEYIAANYPEREVKYYMTTNCSLMDDLFIELMKNNNFTVRLSFDGCKEAHDLNRMAKSGGSYYDKILKNIINVRDRGIPHSIRMTITENTISYLSSNIVFLHEHGLNNICIIPDVNMKFTGESLKEFKRQVESVADYYIQEYDMGRKFTIDQFDGKFFSVLCDYGNCFSMCDAGVGSFKILPDGNIYPCGFLTDNKKFIIGNIKDTVDVDRAKKLANSLYNKHDKKCADCNIKDFCHGMKCGYMNYIRTGSINIPADSVCEYEHVFYPVVTKVIEHFGLQSSQKLNQTLGKYYQYLSTTNLKLSSLGETIRAAILGEGA